MDHFTYDGPSEYSFLQKQYATRRDSYASIILEIQWHTQKTNSYSKMNGAEIEQRGSNSHFKDPLSSSERRNRFGLFCRRSVVTLICQTHLSSSITHRRLESVRDCLYTLVSARTHFSQINRPFICHLTSGCDIILPCGKRALRVISPKFYNVWVCSHV